MTDISLVVLALLIEGLVVAIALLAIWAVVSVRRKTRDRKAAQKLVEQIRHQSQTRLENTGSFLSEKYHFEDDQLKKAVTSIDAAEKKFFMTMINVYLQRDSERLESLDASLAELIDTYKSLEPAVPEPPGLDEETQLELEELRAQRDSLKEELAITKGTMANMISEFGNMFGGGHDHELDKHEVIEKVEKSKPDIVDEVSAEDQADAPADAADSDEIEVSADDVVLDEQAAAGEEADLDVDGILGDELAVEASDLEDEDLLTDEGVDELLNGIDLSSDK